VICCVCVNKCEREIKELAREGLTFEDMREEHGIAVQCGKCEPYVKEYIKEANKK
jgi:bacterioferritin-associated ferredoxin